MSHTTIPTSRFAAIDALRGLGAVSIACFHIHSYGPLPAAADDAWPPIVSHLLDHGWMAVQMFFVVAGFVAAYSLRGHTLGPAEIGNFCLRRLLRLGIPYWSVLVIAAALTVVAINGFGDYSFNESITWPQFLAGCAFLQDILGYENLSTGLWFVCIDLQFGLLFPLLLWLVQALRRGRAEGTPADRGALLLVFLPPAALAMFVWAHNPVHEVGVYYFIHLLFFGAVTWWALEGRLPAAAFWSYAALLVAAIGLHQHRGSDHCRTEELAMALGTGVFLFLLGRAHLIGRVGNTPLLQYLGKISYSLFLIHYPVSWLVWKLGYHLTGTQPTMAAVWLGVALLASIAAADLFYRLVEAPSVRLVQRLKR